MADVEKLSLDEKQNELTTTQTTREEKAGTKLIDWLFSAGKTAPGEIHTDIGLELYQKSLEYDQEQLARDGIKVRWKLDLIVLPMMMITYMIGFLDKQTLNYTNAYDLQPDTKLTGDDYSWVASAVYFGWVIGAYPTNLALQRFPVGKFVGYMLFVWGALCMLQTAVFNFSGFFAVRFFLGLSEACVAPAWLLLSSTLWTRDEQPLRASFWLMTNGLSSIIGAMLSYGLGHVDNSGVPNWGLIFMVVGGLTVAWGFVIVLFMPDGPHNGKMFTQYERMVAVWRIRRNQTGVQHATFVPHQVKEAFLDSKTYMVFLTGVCYGVLNGGVTNFLSALIKGFGFSGLEATLLQTPAGGFQIGLGIAFGFLSTVPNMVTGTTILACVPGMAGLIGILTIPMDERWALVGCAWLQPSLGSATALNWNLPSLNVAGHTKRATVMGFYFVCYCCGNIAGPHLFLAHEAPRYPSAIRGLLGVYGAAIALQLIYCAWCYFENKRRDKLGLVAQDESEAVREGFSDFTDMGNKYFRYRL